MFKQINHIDELRAGVEGMEEIRFIEHSGNFQGYTTACYMVSDNDTFANLWARECRGITFYPDGRVAGRPFHKFFNINEREETQVCNISWGSPMKIMDKRDGSMVNPILCNGDPHMKSKRSFDSDVAQAANKFMRAHENYEEFCRDMLISDNTPIFEYTSPDHRIVVPYEKEELQLLALRVNTTGQYIPYGSMERWSKDYNIPIVETRHVIRFDIGKFIEHVNALEGVEGYVLGNYTGEMYKFKTPWYLNLHHNVTFTRERDVALMVIEENLDDFKSYLTGIGVSHEKVNEIEHRVLTNLLKLRKEAQALADLGKDMDRKEFALRYCKEPLFGIAVAMHQNHEVLVDDRLRYRYIKYHLKNDFSLDQI